MKPDRKQLILYGMISLLCFLLLLSPIGVEAENGPGGGEDLFEALEKSAEGFFSDREAQLESLWKKMEAEEEAKWKQLEQEVLQKWDTYVQTSKKVWVDYSSDREAVSIVNFETGEVNVEAVVPSSKMDPLETAKELISKKVTEMTEKEAPDGHSVMEEMIPEETLKDLAEPKVAPKSAESSSKEGIEESPGAQIEFEKAQKPVIGKDGVERVKVSIAFSLVPDHLKRRSKRYVETVEEQAEKSGIESALVMAVMHTESAFNPMARSPVPAFGLMQLVPRFAGKEAYQQLHGVEKVLTPAYLYHPKNNIELGTIYLARLEKIYFKDVEDPTKRRYIAICAYNWGPTAMRNRFIKRVNVKIEDMSPDVLFRLLQERVPKETKDYLKRVEERRILYRG